MLFGWAQILLFIFLLLSLVPLIGTYMAKVFRGEKTFLHPLLSPVENLSYRIAGVNPTVEMHWKGYLKSLLLFNFFGVLALFLIQMTQQFLPFNPQHFGSFSWSLALNTAISFATNTNWQAYSGETSMSYFTQMCGLTVQNFLSAASGNAALLALIRGIKAKSSEGIGNFWADCIRTVVYLLLPLACIFSLFLISQGVVQSLSSYIEVDTLEGEKQTIPLGPAASQVAIKQLGTNGGGFFRANSAHPFENPNALTNFFEVLAIALIPASAPYMYGIYSGSKRHGWLLFFTMFLLWAAGFILSAYSEHLTNPVVNVKPLLEGKETRIGVFGSILWSTTTTATANGSVNAVLTSLNPLTGGVCLFNMMIGALAFGGLGVGLCNMLMFVLLTVFLTGLMVGRTPEYMGKKIELFEMQWVSFAILVPPALILIGSGIATLVPFIVENIQGKGPHGLTEVLYTFSSTSTNNGSAFTSLNTETLFFNLILGICMLLGRLSIILPSIAIAGSLSVKKTFTVSAGMFSTQTFLFMIMLSGIIIVIGALTFFPALSLGPICEHFLMLRGRSF